MKRFAKRLLWSIILFGLVASCTDSSDLAKDLGTRAVVIGIDGADWKIIDELTRSSELPNLAHLKARGVWGRLDTLHDIPLSPVIWTSVATGKSATKHGISWFLVDRPDGTRVPIGSGNRKVEAIWNVLAANDRRPVVVGWWATFPAEDVGDGVIVSDAVGVHGFGTTGRNADDSLKTHPPSVFESIDVLIPPEQQISFEFSRRFLNLDAADYGRERFHSGRYARPDPSNPVHLFQQYAATAQGYTSIAENLLDEPYDLFLVYYEQVDSFSHLFMKYREPRLEWIEDDASFRRYKNVVTEWYRYQDELLGRILEKIDLDETAVFLVSDHGFKSGDRRIRSEETVDVRRAHLDHEKYGVFIAAGPHIKAGIEILGGSVLDVTPTLLHYLGFPVGKDMDGRVLEDIFASEFTEDNAVAYVTSYEGTSVRVGQSEAPEQGKVETERQLEALKALGYLENDSRTAAAGTPSGNEASSAEIHNNLGRSHLHAGALDEAQAEFERALKLDPLNAEAVLNIGAIHAARGELVLAEHFAKLALKVNPSSPGALAQLAEVARDRDNLEEAIRLFEMALAIDDSEPRLSLGYGDVLQRAGRYGEAEAAFKAVLELDPDSFKARYNLGVTYGKQGHRDEARRLYESALEASPNDPETHLAHNNLGSLYLEAGEPDKAKEHFVHAMRTGMTNLESRYNLALIYLESGNLEEALTLLEEAASFAPNHELLNLRLADAYLQMGRGDDAYRSFLLVRRLYPENWMAAFGLAVLHAQSEQVNDAKRHLAEAIRLGGEEAKASARTFPLLADLLE